MKRIWVYASLVIILILIIRLMLGSKRVTINHVIVKPDQSIFQLNESNNQLLNIISTKQSQVNDLTTEVNALTTTRDNLEQTLELAINNASTQVVITEPVVQDPEIVLLVNLRTELLTFMDANFVPTTIYAKSSPFYISIDGIIENYLNTTTLTLPAFLSKFSDTRTVAFRQAIQDIYNTTTFYVFDTFYTQLSSP